MTKNKLKSRSEYESYLNEHYADAFGLEEAKEHFAYMQNGKISDRTIASNYDNHTLGSLLRKNDPIAFNVGFSEWSR